MKHGSLFSGIGGFDLAAEWAGMESIFQVEIDSYCQKVLAKNFPNTNRYEDIKEFKGAKYKGAVDVISGGFPCQPFSYAGKRKGTEDDRNLWPEYLRVIREVEPSYVVGENVPGLVTMDDGRTLEGILSDMESEGYQVESFLIPACGLGAWHRRERLWIVAYRDRSDTPCADTYCSGLHRQEEQQQGETELRDEQEREPQGLVEDVPDTHACGCKERGGKQLSTVQPSQDSGREAEPYLGGMASRLPSELDGYWDREPEGVLRVTDIRENRNNRLKALGNSIVPQVAYQIFKAINHENDR